MGDKRPNVDDMYARMFSGMAPPPAEKVGEQDNPSPPPKAGQKAEGESPAQRPNVLEQTVEPEETPSAQADHGEKAAKKNAKPKGGGKRTRARGNQSSADDGFPVERYRGQVLNKRGKVHASFWMFPDTLEALELRSFLEKRRGNPGEKSEIVEAALRAYLKNELNASHGEIFAPKFQRLADEDND